MRQSIRGPARRNKERVLGARSSRTSSRQVLNRHPKSELHVTGAHLWRGGGSEKNGLWLTKKNADAQHPRKTPMQELAQLLVMLVAYYATLGIVLIGFGMMVAGKDGAAAAGHFVFVRPLVWVAQQARELGVGSFIASWRFHAAPGRGLVHSRRRASRHLADDARAGLGVVQIGAPALQGTSGCRHAAMQFDSFSQKDR
jgi:hypothetical protein